MKITENKNIAINPNRGKPYITLIPYNRELTLDYVAYWTKRIFKEYPDFILYTQTFVFDGLNETNKLLLSGGFQIRNKHTGEYRIIKKSDLR